MNLARLFVLHAVVTFAAGAVLILAPARIPATVGIYVPPTAYLLCYLLGAAEIGLAFLSYCSRTLTETQSLRIISLTFIVFHLVTAAVELLALARGVDAKILGNVALRLLTSFLFARYGMYKPIKSQRLSF